MKKHIYKIITILLMACVSATWLPPIHGVGTDSDISDAIDQQVQNTLPPKPLTLYERIKKHKYSIGATAAAVAAVTLWYLNRGKGGQENTPQGDLAARLRQQEKDRAAQNRAPEVVTQESAQIAAKLKSLQDQFREKTNDEKIKILNENKVGELLTRLRNNAVQGFITPADAQIMFNFFIQTGYLKTGLKTFVQDINQEQLINLSETLATINFYGQLLAHASIDKDTFNLIATSLIGKNELFEKMDKPVALNFMKFLMTLDHATIVNEDEVSREQKKQLLNIIEILKTRQDLKDDFIKILLSEQNPDAIIEKCKSRTALDNQIFRLSDSGQKINIDAQGKPLILLDKPDIQVVQFPFLHQIGSLEHHFNNYCGFYAIYGATLLIQSPDKTPEKLYPELVANGLVNREKFLPFFKADLEYTAQNRKTNSNLITSIADPEFDIPGVSLLDVLELITLETKHKKGIVNLDYHTSDINPFHNLYYVGDIINKYKEVYKNEQTVGRKVFLASLSKRSSHYFALGIQKIDGKLYIIILDSLGHNRTNNLAAWLGEMPAQLKIPTPPEEEEDWESGEWGREKKEEEVEGEGGEEE